MFGFLFGTACLIGLFRVLHHGRHHHGWGHHHYGGPWGDGGGCGGRGRWGHRHGRGWGGGWDDDDFESWDGPPRGGFALRAIFARLDTTPGQEKAIKTAFDELRAKARAVKEDARGMRGDLANALRGESLDAETLGTVASRASSAVDGVRDAAIGAILKVHEVLDERQRKIVADFLESGSRFGRGWDYRGGPYRGARV
jgi:hypothetical protein